MGESAGNCTDTYLDSVDDGRVLLRSKIGPPDRHGQLHPNIIITVCYLKGSPDITGTVTFPAGNLSDSSGGGGGGGVLIRGGSE